MADLIGPGGIVRLGAAILFIVAGGLFLVARPRTKGTVALGLACLFYAANRVLRTVEVEYFGRPERLTLFNGLSTEVATVLTAVATVFVALHFPRPLEPRHRKGVILVGAVVLAVVVYRTMYFFLQAPEIIASLTADVQMPRENVTYPLLNTFGSTFTWACWFLVGVVAERLRHGVDNPAGLAAVALGLPFNTAIISGGYFLATYAGGNRLGILPATIMSALAGFWMLRAISGPNRRPAVIAMFAWAGGVLYGMLVVAASVPADKVSEFLLASIEGTASSIGAAILLFGIFALRLVQLPMAAGARHASSAAALFLVVLFAIAQVLEDAIGGSAGLAVGATVALASVFVGPRVERLVHNRNNDRSRHEDAYREAVQLALRDGRIESDEERHLVIMAQKLGIGADKAYAIRDEEELLLHGPRGTQRKARPGG